VISRTVHSDTRPILLRGGQTLCQWVESGGSFERAFRLQRLQLRWAGFWFEHHAELTARQCAPASIPAELIFILGLWRSGSTVLHHLLADATGWATPRTWQCFRPADFLLSHAPRERQARRPMDEGNISTFSPQEDEFAALLLGEPSLYRAFIDPRRLNQLSVLLQHWRVSLDAGAPPLSARWETFLKGVSQQTPGPLILKSPNHTFRLPWLARRFPRAQFIWLTRPTPDVLASNKRMWTAMIERYGLWRVDGGMLNTFLEKAVRAHDEVFEWARETLPHRMHVVSFDRVMGDRAQAVTDLLASIGVPQFPNRRDCNGNSDSG
jgi:omega-hydroxy-beta-dihydromenaquinone-9 sulfotransferase